MIRSSRLWVAGVVLVLGCQSNPPKPIDSQVPRAVVTLAPSDEIFRNPERGFYRSTGIIDPGTLSWIEDDFSLYFSYVRLDEYRETDLPAEFLTQLEAGFQMVRDEGAKLILRFSYNFGPYPDSEPDASLERVLGHIRQLGPLLRDNVDVIATLQAGFVGAWGEWHTSTSGLDNVADKTTILEALLDELPETRMVQVRYPRDLMSMLGRRPIRPRDAWSGTTKSRTGSHNDCFLDGDRDRGTYPEPTDPAVFKQYLSRQNLYTSMGGETCGLSPPRSECATALEEMELLRFTFINDYFHPDVVQSWTTGGCRDEMERYLGYRLRALDVDLPEAVAPGEPFVLRIRIENVGWAAPMNPRPVMLILERGGSVFRLEAQGVDVRALLPGSVSTLEFRGIVPPSFEPGIATLSLWLPDADRALALDPRYSIRFANEGVWQTATGVNRVASLTLAPAAAIDEVSGAAPLEAGWTEAGPDPPRHSGNQHAVGPAGQRAGRSD